MEFNFEANFFTMLELMDQAGRLEVESACTKETLPPGEIVYKQGDPAHAVYIIVSGRVEAFTVSPDGKQTRTVGIMGKGDFFGDLAVLTGQPRLAGVRTCEPTRVMQFEKLAFITLLEKAPKVGAFFARNLARRLHHTSTEAHVDIYSIDLAGNLEHFDLLIIFYTLISSGRTGELLLHNSGNDVVGSFFFRAGRLESAMLGHLIGLEAVWQSLIQPAAAGRFDFRLKEQPSSPCPDEHKIQLESNDLLARGGAAREAYAAIPEELRSMEGKLGRLTPELAWDDPVSQELAVRIWELIAKRPQPLDSMWRRLNCSMLAFLQTVGQLINAGQAELQTGETPA